MGKGDRVLADRIEDALARGLPLDALSSDKAVLPQHMRCGGHGVPWQQGPPCRGREAGDVPRPQRRCWRWCSCDAQPVSHRPARPARPKPETLARKALERKAAKHSNKGVRGAKRSEPGGKAGSSGRASSGKPGSGGSGRSSGGSSWGSSSSRGSSAAGGTGGRRGGTQAAAAPGQVQVRAQTLRDGLLLPTLI